MKRFGLFLSCLIAGAIVAATTPSLDARLPARVRDVAAGRAHQATRVGPPVRRAADAPAADAPGSAATELLPRSDRDGIAFPSVAGIDAHVDARGARFSVGRYSFTFAATSIGRDGSASVRLEPGRPEASGNEARADRGSETTEWWRALPEGLEHGFTVRRRPRGEGEIAITLSVRGDLRPRVRGGAVHLESARGRHVATYDQLVVLDAGGRRLPSRFQVTRDHIALVYDDREATYPVVVDPLLYGQAQRLVESPAGIGAEFGRAVAMSGDGQRIVVGQPRSSTSPQPAGAAFVFVKSGDQFVLEQRLVPSGGASGDLFGRAVAISMDGSRVAISAPADDAGGATDRGAVYVFSRIATAWSEEQKLVASDDAVGDALGWSVDMSDDGSRLVAGAYFKNASGASAAGAAYVFARSGTAWLQESKLLASDYAADDQFGSSVAIAGDGTRAVVGAPLANIPGTDGGALYVFARASSTWTEERKLVTTGMVTGARLGFSVAGDRDFTRIVGGAAYEPGPNGSGSFLQGAVYVFTRGGTTWTSEARFTGSAAGNLDAFGTSLAIDAAGATLVVGARVDEDGLSGVVDSGAAYVFTRTTSTWSETQVVTADDAATNDQFGASVGLADDALTLVVGAHGKSSSGTSTGVAYVFALGGLGAPCDDAADCGGGACVDGVCCDSACGGGATDDCMACRGDLTGAEDGTCAPLTATLAVDVTCRPEAGACDVAENCTPTSVDCPADAVLSTNTVCREAAGACDQAESCDGVSVECPLDVFQNGVVCRTAAGPCDVAENCSGAAANCPADTFVASDTVCRASAGDCDVAEVCSGGAPACPGDVRQPVGSPCRPAAGACDVAETCQGGASCPADGFAAASTVCRPVARLCDVAESCSGLAPSCPADSFATDGTPCDDGLVCSQTSACQLGTCEPAITRDCSDGDPCTTDSCVEPVGCTRIAIPACGVDSGTAIDAGFDAGALTDAGADVGAPQDSGSDASQPVDARVDASGAATGCSCGVAGAPRSGAAGSLVLVALLASTFGRRLAGRRRAR